MIVPLTKISGENCLFAPAIRTAWRFALASFPGRPAKSQIVSVVSYAKLNGVAALLGSLRYGAMYGEIFRHSAPLKRRSDIMMDERVERERTRMR